MFRRKLSLEKLILEEAQAARDAMRRVNYRVDAKLESLHELDRAFEENVVRGQPVPGGFFADDTPRRIFAMGALAGEIVRGYTNAQWRGSLDAGEGWNIELIIGTMISWPMQRVSKRFFNGAEDSLYAWGYCLCLDAKRR